MFLVVFILSIRLVKLNTLYKYTSSLKFIEIGFLA